MLDKNEILNRIAARNFERYAFPGGYEIFAVMTDSETLCVPCLNDPSNPIHFQGEDDGWGIDSMENMSNCDEPEICAHCGRVIE